MLLKEVQALVVLLLLLAMFILWVEEEWLPPLPVVAVVPLKMMVQ
jgi:hypothetical protein